jgi:hypothetical protein
MHGIVRQSFPAFLEPMEGNETCMYQDHEGQVTTGIGNMIDSSDVAWTLPRKHGVSWFHVDDMTREATQAEVAAEWRRVKNDPETKKTSHARATAKLVLTEQGVLDMLHGDLRDRERVLKRHGPFSRLEEWPADAQLGLFSMAWAMGSGFGPRFPNFSREVAGATPHWGEALTHCNMKNSWMIRRNAVSRGLFRNAHWATTEQQAFDRLYIVIPGRRPVLKLGDTDATHAGQGFDSDECVSDMQGFIQYPEAGTITGVFDQNTKVIVEGFQLYESTHDNNKNFPVDGEVGTLTWASLGYVVGRR